jgi:DNA-binding Xre family transcriptional regulator
MIKKQAKIKGIAIKDMLSNLGLGINTLSHMNHGRSLASDSLARIADYLDCSVDYLLGRTDNPDVNK